MRELIRRLRCWVGLHYWKQDRPVVIMDIFPMDPDYDTPTRMCERCGKKEMWLPGYGSFEIGCWTNPPK
nr:hypothetical protein 22 [Candidatus Omnitrophota bacterium]